MDIQFIVDVYSCAQYVINYISKSRGELSKTLQDIVKQLHKGNTTLPEKLHHLTNTFLNTSEFSAQECVYYILGYPISECSREIVFINTTLPDDRIRIFKPKKQLQELPDDSEDVFTPGKIEAYEKRPKNLENVCLADFVASYTKKTKNKEFSDYNVKNDNDDDYDYDDDDNVGNNLYFSDDDSENCNGKRKRKKKKIFLMTLNLPTL